MWGGCCKIACISGYKGLGLNGEGELRKESTCKEYLQVQQEGKRKVSRIVKYHIPNRKDGSKRLADNTLTALTLMIAESKIKVKDVMVKVVLNMIN